MSRQNLMQRFMVRVLCTLWILGSSVGCNLLLSDKEEAGECGDGIIQEHLGEECDDGNDINDDDCTNLCKGGCGDGKVSFPERCDDGNDINGDGCNPRCNLFGKISVFAGHPGGRGMVDGIGSTARVAEVATMVYDDTLGPGKERIIFWDNGSCTIRNMDLVSGKIQTLAGMPGNCGHKDGLFEESTFMSWDYYYDALDFPVNQVRLGKDLYHFYSEFPPRRLDLQTRTVTECPPLHTDLKGLRAVTTDGEKLFMLTRPPSFSSEIKVWAVNPCTNDEPTLLKRFTLNGPEAMDHDMVTAKENGRRVFYISEKHVIWRLEPGAENELTIVAGKARNPQETKDQIGEKHVIEYLKPGAENELTIVAEKTDDPQGTTYRDAAKGTDAVFGGIADLSYVDGRGLYVLDWTDGNDECAKPGWSTIRLVGIGNGWPVTTVAGVVGDFGSFKISESDGFGLQARIDRPHTMLEDRGVLYFGGPSAIRALNLDSKQVATTAGQLVQDMNFTSIKSVAAIDGIVYVANNWGNVRRYRVKDSSPVGVTSNGILPYDDNCREIKVSIISMVAHGKLLYFTFQAYNLYGVAYVDASVSKSFPTFIALGTPGLLNDSPKLVTIGNDGIVYVMKTEMKDGKSFIRLYSATLESILENPQVEEIKLEPNLVGAIPEHPLDIQFLDNKLFVTSEKQHQIFVLDLNTKTWITPLGRPDGGESIDSLPDGGVSIDSRPSFCYPLGLTTDGRHLYVGEGTCFIQDPDSHELRRSGNAIREVYPVPDADPDRYTVTTLIGPGTIPYFQAGTGKGGSVNRPAGLAYDNETGNIFVADMWDNAIFKIE